MPLISISTEHPHFKPTRAFAESKMSEWLAEGHGGQFVLIKDLEVHGFYPTEDEVYKAGYEKFGNGNFFVIQPFK